MGFNDFFINNNGKKEQLNNAKHGVRKEQVDKKFHNLFDAYDTNKDGTLDDGELQGIFTGLAKFAVKDKTLDASENKQAASLFAKEKNIKDADFMGFVKSISDVNTPDENKPVNTKNEFVPQNNEVSQTVPVEQKEKACKETVIGIIDDNISDAEKILNSQYLGSISGAYDNDKDDDDKLKTSNVQKVLDYQKTGEIQIINAKEGNLTRRAYYEENKQRLKDMILTRLTVLKAPSGLSFLDEHRGKYSKEQFTKIISDYIETISNNVEIDKLKDMQKQFVTFSTAEEVGALDNFVNNAINFSKNPNELILDTMGGEGKPKKIKNPSGIIPSYWDSAEPIKFEEVYKIERGTEYSQYKVEQYVLAKKEMETVANAYNKKQQFVDFAKSITDDKTLTVDDKTKKILELYSEFYALSDDNGMSELKKSIETSNTQIKFNENGIDLSAYQQNEQMKHIALNKLLSTAISQKESDFKEFLGDKTIEEYQEAFERAANDILGEDNAKMLSEAMKNDNMTVIQRYTGNASMAGMGMTVVGGILCFTPLAPLGAALVTVGNVTAIGGMVAKTGLGVADYVTKDVQTTEEFEDLAKDFVVDAGGFIVGMGAGKAGVKAFSKLIDKKLSAVFAKEITAGNRMQALQTVLKNPAYLKNFMTAAGAKIGTDFMISYVGDLAMMGMLDTKDDWKSLLQANLTGILIGTSGDVKDLAGVGKSAVRVRNSSGTTTGKPVTQLEYGRAVLGKEVTIKDPETGAEITGVVTKVTTKQGMTKVEVDGKEYSTDDVTTVKEFATPETEVETETARPESRINIPAGKFEAPNAKFAETDDAFRSIVTKRFADIKELDKISDIDEFCRKSFELMKEEMGLEDSDIKLEITDKDNYYDHETNTVYISRNWAGKEKGHVKGKGDKAEIFGGMAHELNHYLQWKEIVLNFDSENPNWNEIISYLQQFEGAQKNIEYLIEKYPDNTELKEAFEKAKSYQDNWLNYTDAFDENGKLKTGAEYDKYRNQTVEAESFRRGDIVAEEYRTVADTKSAETETSKQPTILQRLETANDRESFVAIRDEIKNMPAGKEKQTLAEEYTKAYSRWSSNPERPDIRMEYKPDVEVSAESSSGIKIKLPMSAESKNYLIEYKDGKTEKEILIEKVDNMIENILSRVDTSGYNTQKLKGIDLIEELIWDDVDLKLTPEEKELMKTIIIKQGHDSLTADKISDKHILYRFSDSFKEMTEPRNDISYLLRCLQNNNNLSDEQFNSSEVYQTYYKDNVFKKLTNKEINIITEILRNDKGSVDELIEHSKFDYSEIAKRDLVNLIENKLGVTYNEASYYKEFLYCTREEFEAKIQRLNERPELIDNIKKFGFKAWQNLLNMPKEKFEFVQEFAQELAELKTYEDTPFFNQKDISSLCEMTPEQINTARQRGLFSELPGQEHSYKKYHFKANDIIELSSVSNERWEQMEALDILNDHKTDIYPKLAKMTDEQFARIPQDIYPNADLLAAVKLDDNSWNRYKNDFMKRDDFTIESYNMETVLKFDDANYNKFKELSQIKFDDTDTRFQDFEILKILDANLDEKAYARVKNELSQMLGLNTSDVIDIAKLDDKAYEILKENYLNPNGDAVVYVANASNCRTGIKFARELASNEYREINKYDLSHIFEYLNDAYFDIALTALTDKDVLIPTSSIANLINNLDLTYGRNDKDAIIKLMKDKDICSNEMLAPVLSSIGKTVNGENYNDVKSLLNTLLQDEYAVSDEVSDILNNANSFYPKDTNKRISLALKLANDPKFPNEMISRVIQSKDFDYDIFVEKVYNNITNAKELREVMVDDLSKNMSRQDAITTVYHQFNSMIENYEVVEALLKAKDDFSGKDMSDILFNLNSGNKDNVLDLISNYKKMELLPNQVALLAAESENISYKKLQHLNSIMGREKVGALPVNDLKIACNFADLYGKQNINEIPISKKRDLLRSLVASNVELFSISEELSKEFPLIPKSQEEYCSLLPSFVRSLGIETKELTPEQRITMFNSSMGELSESLVRISDSDFAQMTITQEYPKDKFILDILDKVKSLPASERQKVYDYFGFELHHNKNNQTGFSITGYPVNINNGKKLAQIENPRTKAVVEELRPNVIRFSENNKIQCNNPQVEHFLNEVVDALPEIRTTISRTQHGSHEFDVMQHSLKVMQKIAQDPKFEKLNESDKKIIMLASLMHDITKSEGKVDKMHANGSSFDTFFIAQKFNLSKEEEIKLHTLIKQHEWLEFVNTAKTEEELTKRLQSVAYDLQQGNLFDMAEIFTHADLRAVKADDSFHDTTEGKNRVSFDGTVRSFGESANVYAQRIREYVSELQKSQPLLPQTRIPRASRIEQAITHVNPDGSTNIKGVYKDKDGLIIIKFNEVQDWETIGFPEGSISRGITTEGVKGDNIDTGNIKFFVHGLDYSNQLAKFDAFSLVDSDALLSVSYAERPESKFRFFRPQGVLLDVNSKYIHGGGNTDSGSGCGKSIQNFKADYIFGGYRESDRLYVSELIKEATGMTDEQYIKFVEENRDKSLQEIEPIELRDKLVKAFATINSNTRKGNRQYNEMYVSNPNEVMGVFAYSLDYREKINNPVEFLNRTSIGTYERGYNGVGDVSVKDRTEFLRQYALKRGLPFIIFGD